MKKGIHPEMRLLNVRCACGAEHKIWTTKEQLKVDVCSNCHPLYKGSGGASLIVDTEGRVQKFKKKFEGKY